MKDKEFKAVLTNRRKDLGLTYRQIQNRTALGYNTVRRVFSNPFNCRIGSVLRVAVAMGCDLLFTVENKIGDELEPEVSVESLTQKDADGLSMVRQDKGSSQFDIDR